jgi:hypothetical protein
MRDRAVVAMTLKKLALMEIQAKSRKEGNRFGISTMVQYGTSDGLHQHYVRRKLLKN